jgi:hypothetical protein
MRHGTGRLDDNPGLLQGPVAQPKYFVLDLGKEAMYCGAPTQKESGCLSTTAP